MTTVRVDHRPDAAVHARSLFIGSVAFCGQPYEKVRLAGKGEVVTCLICVRQQQRYTN